MVIQRIQTLLLLLALGAMVTFTLTPFASLTIGGITATATPCDQPILLTISVTASLLLLADIFMYKNLKRQITIAAIAALLECGAAITAGIMAFVTLEHATPVLAGGIIAAVAALVLTLAARRYMIKDKELLRSYDRLR